MAMTDEQIERYSRHIILKEVGAKGQKKLLKGKVLIIGAGGLGAPAAMYLAAAGVGTIGIVDADEVDLSNLQRQIIHSTVDIGKAKVKSAKETMNAMNPDVEVKTYRMFVDASNIRELIREYDFIIDGTDNFPAKFLTPAKPDSKDSRLEPPQPVRSFFLQTLPNELSQNDVYTQNTIPLHVHL